MDYHHIHNSNPLSGPHNHQDGYPPIGIPAGRRSPSIFGMAGCHICHCVGDRCGPYAPAHIRRIQLADGCSVIQGGLGVVPDHAENRRKVGILPPGHAQPSQQSICLRPGTGQAPEPVGDERCPDCLQCGGAGVEVCEPDNGGLG